MSQRQREKKTAEETRGYNEPAEASVKQFERSRFGGECVCVEEASEMCVFSLRGWQTDRK